MASVELVKISFDHVSVYRSKHRILPPILLRWHWSISVHKMEWSPSNYFRVVVLLHNLYVLLHHLQIHLWYRYRHCHTFISNIHVINNSKSLKIIDIDQVKSLLGLRVFSDFCSCLVFTLFSSMESVTFCNLSARCVCSLWTPKKWKIKLEILVGS